MQRITRGLGALLAFSVLAFAADAPAAGKRAVLDAYCSPTGDVCFGVNARPSGIKLEISTPSFSGQYTLCVRGPQRKRCRDFTLESQDGAYFDRVDWARKFGDQGAGRYKAVWKLGVSRLGEALHFRVGEPR